jgi:hypothetical protein
MASMPDSRTKEDGLYRQARQTPLEPAPDPSAPMLRLVYEGLAIVISILLAFAIDAWWEERQEQADASVAISGLLGEFEENLRQLRLERDSHRASLQSTLALLNMMGPDPARLPELDDFAPLLLSCVTNANFLPRLGTLNSLIASGRLRLIEDPELRQLLTDWPAYAQDMIEWEQVERQNTEQFLLRFTLDFVAYPDLMAILNAGKEQASAIGNLDDKVAMSFSGSAFDSDIKGLLSSLRFEGMLTSRAVNLRQLIEQSQSLEQQIIVIIERLSAM